MNWAYVSLGLSLLLGSSFLDNVRGPLLPVLSNAFQLTHTDSSLFLIAGSIGGILSTAVLISASRETSERKVLLGLILFTLFMMGFSFAVQGYWSLLAFGLGIGASISALGAMANLVVIQGASREFRGRALSLLHTVYGFGSFLAPSLVGLTLVSPISWRTPFCLLGIGLLFVLVGSQKILPPAKAAELQVPERVTLNRFQIFTIIMFSTYVAGEVMVSMWMVTFLVEAAGKTVTEASDILGAFFLFMMASRIVTFLLARAKTEKVLLILSLVVAIFFFCWGLTGQWALLPGTGLFGPFFPLLLARVTRLFHHQTKNITFWIIGVNALFIMVSHRLMGFLADSFGIGFAYHFPAFVLVVAILLFLIYLRWERKAVA